MNLQQVEFIPALRDLVFRVSCLVFGMKYSSHIKFLSVVKH
jgi:hypothetical protein